MAQTQTFKLMQAKQWAGIIALALVNALICHFTTFRHFYPGQWRGETGLLGPIDLWALPLIALDFGFAGFLLKGHRLTIPMILLALGAVSICWLPTPRPEARVEAERASYLQAVKSGSKLGDQHEAMVDGRKLIYWRWAQWGLDNAIGVIYDPEDRFAQGNQEEMEGSAEDRHAFFKVSSGGLFASKRMGDGLYLVKHS